MPRPTRIRFLVAPSLSRISLSFIAPSSSRVVEDAHEMRDLSDHAANGGGVFELGDTVKLVQLQAHQRLALGGLAADRRTDLLDADSLASHAALPLRDCGFGLVGRVRIGAPRLKRG